jgi:HAD superfamily hydrolase (TIGR01509 family)
MIKAIIFDMDGVLVNSYDAWFSIFNKALKHFENKAISDDEFSTKVWAKNFNETARVYFQAPREDILAYFDKYQDDFNEAITLFGDVKSTLERLKKKGIQLCVATNTHTTLAQEMLAEMGILDFFDYIVGGDKVANGKPEPDMLLKLIKDLKLKKDDVWFIGDTIWDKIAAEKANITFIGLKLDATNRIDSLSELVRLVR